MNIARIEPWSYVDLLNRDLQRATPRRTSSEWVPAVDILEANDHFLLRADVPGVAPSDIEASMEKGTLTISGARQPVEHDENTSIRRSESAKGRFQRRFTLPETVDAENIKARCSDGILEITVPKVAEIQPRRITVEAA